jgi:hypothetical protein
MTPRLVLLLLLLLLLQQEARGPIYLVQRSVPHVVGGVYEGGVTRKEGQHAGEVPSTGRVVEGGITQVVDRIRLHSPPQQLLHVLHTSS